MSEESPEQQSATAMKLATAKQKKDTADQAFKQGDATAGWSFSLFLSWGTTISHTVALMAYHQVPFPILAPIQMWRSHRDSQSLMYLLGLDK